MKIKIFSIFLFSIFSSSSTHAFFWRGHELMRGIWAYERYDSSDVRLREPGDPQYIGSYLGFVYGVHDSLDGILVCASSNATEKQVVSVVTKYLNNNPEKWDSPARNLVTEALSTAFPCRKK